MTVYCDVDGTLLDSSARHVQLLRDLLQQAGRPWPVTAPEYLPYKADGHSTLAWLEAAGTPPEAAQQIAAAWQAQIETAPYLALDRAYPDAVPFLQAVRQIPAQVVLVSARQQPDALRATLQRCGLLAWADDLLVVPPRQAARQKAAVLRGRAQPGDVMVGDTEADWQAAQMLGLPCFVLERGFRSRAYWQRQGVAAYAGLRAVLRALTGQE